MLKYSRYNHSVKIPGEDAVALVNFRSGAIMRLTPFQQMIFERAEEFSQETNFIKKLREAGFLVAYDELRHMRTEAFFESGRGQELGLTLCPTLSCNFACPYCFEKARSGRMSREIEAAILKFAKENMEQFGLKKLNVTWFGGEPLLCPDIIERLSVNLKALCEELSADYHASIITNGWFLTEENLRLLERSDVTFIQVTLDGPTPETNDHSRKEKGGGSSFARIMENLKKIRPYGHPPTEKETEGKNLPRVRIRCNLNRENIQHYGELRNKIEAIAAETGADISIGGAKMNLYDAPSPELAQKEISMSEYAASQKEEDMLTRWGSLFYRGVYCMVHGLHGYCIDELGNLYKCWEDVGRNEFSFGNVRDFGDAKEPLGNVGAWDAYYETLFPEQDKECMNCKIFPLCLGGCPHKRLMNHKECISWKDDLDGYVLARYRLWKKDKAQVDGAPGRT